eukprot:NODE_3093_length_599_cov_43.010909_g2589_i0.p2 GENE.NODE_3093_length_599_cov_43.010909_g2589_i0~~NODE_3093_length_599_cov_43.010909_g2589_i0.p2  ORF type:complete len:90 (-),score=3.90 NODE_3093_length_599_cov_43.010909_g2589_i0:154-423(-)
MSFKEGCAGGQRSISNQHGCCTIFRQIHCRIRVAKTTTKRMCVLAEQDVQRGTTATTKGMADRKSESALLCTIASFIGALTPSRSMSLG